MNFDVPNILYRGITLDYNMLQNFRFFGVDLVPAGRAIINEKEEKFDGVGNEYGIYMSDNYHVSVQAYANPQNGLIINRDISYGSNAITIPKIGVVYQIDTKGLVVREPYICSAMKGHYNNGYIGKEYITDSISADNYKIIKIIIGADLLHDSENIDVVDIEKTEQIVRQRLEERKKHLEEFVKFLSKMDINKRKCLRGGRTLDVFKILFGDASIVYSKLSDIELHDASDCIRYLLLYYYISSINNLDIRTLIEINSVINEKLNKNSSLEDFIEIMNQEIANKNSDRMREKYKDMLNIIKNKLNEDAKKKQYENEINSNSGYVQKYDDSGFSDLTPNLSKGRR